VCCACVLQGGVCVYDMLRSAAACTTTDLLTESGYNAHPTQGDAAQRIAAQCSAVRTFTCAAVERGICPAQAKPAHDQ
jgi:hypothetical protein